MFYMKSHKISHERLAGLFIRLSGSKVAGLIPAALLKKRLRHRCFPVNFEEILRIPSLLKHLRWLRMNLTNNLTKLKVTKFQEF